MDGAAQGLRTADGAADLTTGEYASIRLSIAYYVKALPKIEVGALAVAHDKALRQLRAP